MLIITIIVMLVLAGAGVYVAINSNLIGTTEDAIDALESAYENEKNLGNKPVLVGDVIYPSYEAYSTGWYEYKDDEGNIVGVNFPKLMNGMVAVYWTANSGETAEEVYSKIDVEGNASSKGTINPNFEWDEWFNYTAQTSGIDGTSRWANAITDDGSYWVWIPRFEYKIDGAGVGVTGESEDGKYTNSGVIDVKLIPTSQTTADENYTIHPAFIKNVDLGGWINEIEGFWVAKYEMSQEVGEKKGEGENAEITWKELSPRLADSNVEVNYNYGLGNVATTNAGNTILVRAVSKPGLSSWRWINIANAYENSYYYDRDKESHLMKNSEWGAVAYLTHSKYGRNGKEVAINNSVIAGSENYLTNTNQSSTGNITGIYDLSGGAQETVASYNAALISDTKNEYLGGVGGNSKEQYKPESGAHFAYVANGKSTKYATAYYNGTSQLSIEEAFVDGESTINTFDGLREAGTIVSKLGDAIEEVHVQGEASWNSDVSRFIFNISPFYTRGGYGPKDNEFLGIFYSSYVSGSASYQRGFRVVLTP